MSANATVPQETPAATAPTAELRSIPLSQISVAEGFNPRGEVIEDAELQALAQTMRERGCLAPIRVRATDGGYVLIAGGRRFRAAPVSYTHLTLPTNREV